MCQRPSAWRGGSPRAAGCLPASRTRSDPVPGHVFCDPPTAALRSYGGRVCRAGPCRPSPRPLTVQEESSGYPIPPGRPCVSVHHGNGPHRSQSAPQGCGPKGCPLHFLLSSNDNRPQPDSTATTSLPIALVLSELFLPALDYQINTAPTGAVNPIHLLTSESARSSTFGPFTLFPRRL